MIFPTVEQRRGGETARRGRKCAYRIRDQQQQQNSLLVVILVTIHFVLLPSKAWQHDQHAQNQYKFNASNTPEKNLLQNFDWNNKINRQWVRGWSLHRERKRRQIRILQQVIPGGVPAGGTVVAPVTSVPVAVPPAFPPSPTPTASSTSSSSPSPSIQPTVVNSTIASLPPTFLGVHSNNSSPSPAPSFIIPVLVIADQQQKTNPSPSSQATAAPTTPVRIITSNSSDPGLQSTGSTTLKTTEWIVFFNYRMFTRFSPATPSIANATVQVELAMLAALQNFTSQPQSGNGVLVKAVENTTLSESSKCML